MRKNKRGQESNPAVLIAIIMLIIILYLILVPPEYRENILGDGNYTDDDDYSDYDVTFVDKSPGYWTYNSMSSVEHDLNSFNLYSRSEASKVIESDDVFSKTTAFSKTIGSVTFDVQDISKMQNFFINYKISSISGNAYMILNGNTIKEIKSNSKEDVIAIDKGLLKAGDNKIEFISESVGFSFWKSNQVKFLSVTVNADRTDDSGLYNSQKFWIKSDELKNIDTSSLRYYVDCEVSSSGKLDVIINGVRIFSGIPDCKMLNSINNIDPSIFRENENSIDFRSSGGRFIIDNVLLKSELKDNEYPIYYFTVEDYDYDVLQTELVDLNLTVTFPSEDEYHEVLAVLNGHGIGINTYDRVYTVSVDPDDIVDGNNVLEIRPKKSMHIVNVELRAVFD